MRELFKQAVHLEKASENVCMQFADHRLDGEVCNICVVKISRYTLPDLALNLFDRRDDEPLSLVQNFSVGSVPKYVADSTEVVVDMIKVIKPSLFSWHHHHPPMW